MLYEFQSLRDGRVIEREFRIAEAPPLGSTIVVDGEEFERIVSQPHVNMQPSHWNYPVVSRSLPRRLEGCEHTPDGKPIIRNKAHERELASKFDLRRADDF